MRRGAIVTGLVLLAGFSLIVSGVPVAYSGLGGPPRLLGRSLDYPGPPGAWVIRIYGVTFYLEPAFFTGLVMIAAGALLLRQGVRLLGIRTEFKPPLPTWLHKI